MPPNALGIRVECESQSDITCVAQSLRRLRFHRHIVITPFPVVYENYNATKISQNAVECQRWEAFCNTLQKIEYWMLCQKK